jgi:hypothetical protein
LRILYPSPGAAAGYANPVIGRRISTNKDVETDPPTIWKGDEALQDLDHMLDIHATGKARPALGASK